MNDNNNHDENIEALSPALHHPKGGQVFVNPGTGAVHGATEANANTNMQIFVQDCIKKDNALLDLPMTWMRRPELDYGDGRYAYIIYWDDKKVEIQMPGWETDKVRYMRSEGQNIWHFPRLYENGSSWVWEFAINCTVSDLFDVDNDDYWSED